MLEVGGRGNCEDCIDRSRTTLLVLARQYTASDHWVRNQEHRLAGEYSLLAIHAIGRRIDIDKPPRDIRGPFLRDDPDIEADERQLIAVKVDFSEGQFRPEAIRELRDIAARRQQSYNTFLNRGKNYWDREARKAEPFLDQMMSRDPSESPQKRERFQRVYWLDQGAFILAKMLLGKCSGPWFRMCPYGEKYQRFHIPVPRSDTH